MITNRLLIGALAGIAGTFAMTAAARAMHRGLPAPERYPLPPREIIEGVLSGWADVGPRSAGGRLQRSPLTSAMAPRPARCTPFCDREAAFCRERHTGFWLDPELFRHHAGAADFRARPCASRAPQRAHDRGSLDLGQHHGAYPAGTGTR